MATATVSLKLLVDPKSRRVLFAESGKDFVDFLFNILWLPVGTVIRLLTKKGMVGCLGNLYDSIENLDVNYMQPTANKGTLMKPIVSNNAANVPLLLPNMKSSKSSNLCRCSYYYSSNCRPYVANDPNSIVLTATMLWTRVQLWFIRKTRLHPLLLEGCQGSCNLHDHGRSDCETYVNYF